MSGQLNEFSIDLPMSTPVPPLSPPVEYVQDNGYGSEAASVYSPADQGDDIAVAIGDVAETDPSNDPSKITIYAGNITPISYGDSDPISCFDITFTVGVNCEGTSKTYQVVKRIGIDKCKLAAQASAGSPVSVVEAIKSVDPESQYIIKLEHSPGKFTYYNGTQKYGNGKTGYLWNAATKNAKVFDSMSEVAKMMNELDREDPMVYDHGHFKDRKHKLKMEGVLLSNQKVEEQKQSLDETRKRARRLAGLE